MKKYLKKLHLVQYMNSCGQLIHLVRVVQLVKLHLISKYPCQLVRVVYHDSTEILSQCR